MASEAENSKTKFPRKCQAFVNPIKADSIKFGTPISMYKSSTHSYVVKWPGNKVQVSDLRGGGCCKKGSSEWAKEGRGEGEGPSARMEYRALT